MSAAPRFVPGDVVRVLANDAKVPVGADGVVMGTVAETGNVRVLLNRGTPGERPVSFTPDSLALIDGAAPAERPEPAPRPIRPAPPAPAPPASWRPFDPRPAVALPSRHGLRLSPAAADLLGGAARVEVLADRARGAIGLRPVDAGGVAPTRIGRAGDGSRFVPIPGLGDALAPRAPRRKFWPVLEVSRDPDGVLVVAGVPFAEGRQCTH